MKHARLLTSGDSSRPLLEGLNPEADLWQPQTKDHQWDPSLACTPSHSVTPPSLESWKNPAGFHGLTKIAKFQPTRCMSLLSKQKVSRSHQVPWKHRYPNRGWDCVLLLGYCVPHSWQLKLQLKIKENCIHMELTSIYGCERNTSRNKLLDSIPVKHRHNC
jgi:hypothetical protein